MKPLKKELIESGHVEKVLLKMVSEEYANDPDLANTQAIRLIMPYVAKEMVEEDDDDEDEGGGKCCVSKVCGLTTSRYAVCIII